LTDGQSLDQLTNLVKKKRHHVAIENINRRETIAKDYQTTGSKLWNKVITLGQYDEAERQETINQIRSGTKAPPKEAKSHGGGGESHAPKAHAPSGGGGGSSHPPAGGGGATASSHAH